MSIPPLLLTISLVAAVPFLNAERLAGSLPAIECPPEATGPGGVDIQGRVVEGSARVPLGAVTIRLEVPGVGELVTRSDMAGRYRFCEVPWSRSLRGSADLAGVIEGEFTIRMPDGATEIEHEIALGVNQPGALTGRVVRGIDHRPVQNAEVVVITEPGRSATTNRQGRFFIDGLPPGPHRVAVDHVGFSADTVQVQVRSRAATEVELRTQARVYELEPVVVHGTHSGFLRDFKHRQARAVSGHFVGRQEIESRPATRLGQLLQEVPGLRVHTGPHRATLIYTARAVSSIQDGSLCLPEIYVDGVRTSMNREMEGRDNMLDQIHPSSIEGIEVYLGASSLPAEYSGSTGGCGVIGIWTRRGFD